MRSELRQVGNGSTAIYVNYSASEEDMLGKFDRQFDNLAKFYEEFVALPPTKPLKT